MDAIKIIEAGSVQKELPEFKIGDTVKVGVRIREGKNERVQMFEGTVIAIKGSGISKTFTVRRVSYGVGIERVFPFATVRFAVLSFITSETELVRLLRLKKIFKFLTLKPLQTKRFSFIPN